MSWTYEQLLTLAAAGDPLIDPARPERASITEEGLVIHGYDDETGYATDLRISIDSDNRLHAWIRDPEGAAETIFGREWTHGTPFDTYEALVDWAYQW